MMTVLFALFMILAEWVREGRWEDLIHTSISSIVFFMLSFCWTCILEMRRRRLPGPGR